MLLLAGMCHVLAENLYQKPPLLLAGACATVDVLQLFAGMCSQFFCLLAGSFYTYLLGVFLLAGMVCLLYVLLVLPACWAVRRSCSYSSA